MKEKLAKILAAARKQMALLICGAVVVIGVVLCYWPTQGWYSQLKDKVSTSVGVEGQINTLLKHERHLPNLSLDANATPPDLTVFPTDDVYQKGLAAVKSLGDQSQQLLAEAVQFNTHLPLYPNALPAGNDFDRASFASAYKDAMTDDARIRKWPPDDLQRTIPALMAGRRITEADIQAAQAAIQNQIDIQFPPMLPNGQPNTDAQAQGKAVFAQRTQNLALSLESDAARKCKVYLETGAIKPPAVYDQFKAATSALPVEVLWPAQLALWIDEDVATAVARANADASSVLDSPIKQITDLAVKDPPYLISGDPTAGTDSTPLTPVPDVSPTGRVCNGMYDVVQFSLSIDADANRVSEVLDAIQRGQFITVLSVQSQAVDSYERATERFLYGNGPIVHLDLVCEEMLLHAWTAKYQPPDAGAAKYAAGGAGGTGTTSNLLTITTHTGG